MTLRIAVGPIDLNGKDDWPLVKAPSLRSEGCQIVPFTSWSEVPDADAVVYWSPEYQPPEQVRLEKPNQFKVAFLGDWHINVPGDIAHYDLIATDYRGTKMLRERGIPESKILWWRGFSFDPRLHTPPEHEARHLDVAFCGRSAPGRDELLNRVAMWCKETDHRCRLIIEPYERGVESSYYRSAKIVLGHAQRGELQLRAYESIACGALYVCQHDTDEIWQANAPIPTYEPSLLPDFLGAWLEDAAARQAKVREQYAWSQKETPARHLRYLCEQIKERMERGGRLAQHTANGGTGGVRSSDRDVAGVVDSVHRMDDLEVDPPENEQRLECVSLVPRTAERVLDIGCNAGGFLWALKKDRPGIHVAGVEADYRLADTARERLDAPTDIYKGPIEDFLSSESLSGWGRFDAITALDVLEHLTDPTTVLTRLRPLLDTYGVIVASIPNIRNVANAHAYLLQGKWDWFENGKDTYLGPHCNVWSRDHLRFWTRDTIDREFRRAGYRIERWEKSLLSAPSLDHLVDELAWLAAKYGGDAEEWKSDAWTIQHIVVARPDWTIAVTS